MFRMRFTVGINERIIAATVIASFGAMVLALPTIRWLHLQQFARCPFHALTGFPCPTCGYTRVYDLILAGHWMQAVIFQPFILAIVILSAIIAVMATISLIGKMELVLSRKLVRGIWVTLAISWAWNLCHGI